LFAAILNSSEIYKKDKAKKAESQ